jgi:hypothetical protein
MDSPEPVPAQPIEASVRRYIFPPVDSCVALEHRQRASEEVETDVNLDRVRDWTRAFYARANSEEAPAAVLSGSGFGDGPSRPHAAHPPLTFNTSRVIRLENGPGPAVRSAPREESA